MRTWFPVACCLGALLGGCSGRASSVPVAPKPKASAAPAAHRTRPLYITPSILIPDLPTETAAQGYEPDGSRRAIVAQMRVLERPDGSIERASSLLPTHSRLLTSELPSRLGGGFVFVVSGDSSAQLWRSASWLAPLEPLASTNQPIHELIPGFDRLYLRHARNGPLYGLDLDKGEYTDSARLPVPNRIGPAFFADSWRAVVVTDLRGALATFDAGMSWYPLDLRSPVLKVAPSGDRIQITTRDENWLLSADGALTGLGLTGSPVPTAAATATYTPPYYSKRPPTQPPPPPPPTASSSDRVVPQVDRPLGRRPLRIALERGVPLSGSQALVAHGGNLALVDVNTGTVKEIHRDVYPQSYTECTAIPLGQGLGFVCGKPQGATTVFRYDLPARMTPVLQWPKPQAVFSSGNGALVVRAPCPGGAVEEGLSQYCVRNLQGLTRELRFKGDVGAERVVVLADGRIAVLIAPRPGAEGRLVLLQGQKSIAYVLDFQNVPRPVVEMARRGLWMNSVQEITPGSLGVWVEAGGPVVGLRIDLKGRVTAGPVQKTASDTGDIVVAGQFGLVWKSLGRGQETMDGGLTWKEVELPGSPIHAGPERRACTGVGCVIGGWLRVGWGTTRTEHDLEAPRKPPLRTLSNRSSRSLSLQCEATGRISPPPATAPAAPQETAGHGPVHYRYGHGGMVAVAPPGYGYWQAARWLPFGPIPAPQLGADEEGLSTSSRDYGEVRPSYRIYVWGPKSADWTRAGHWIIRFDDPFDTTGLPKSTSIAVSPWPDISTASSVLNSRSDSAWFDPELKSGVIGWCHGPKQCKYFGLAPNELPVPFSSNDPAGVPYIFSALRSEDNWYFLSSNGLETELWSANLSGIVRKIRSFQRLEYGEQLVLTRRARSPGLGLLVTSPLPGRSQAEWIVLPVDPTSGRILGAERLGPTDFDGRLPPPCTRDQDGWQIDNSPGTVPNVSLPGRPYVSDIRAKLRVDTGRACVVGLTGRTRRPEGTTPWPPRGPAANPAAPPGVLLTVWEGEQGRKIEFACQAGPASHY